MKRIPLVALAVAAALALACRPERPVPLTPRVTPQPPEQKNAPPQKDAREPVQGKRIAPGSPERR